jgi:Rieske Fe-S protein
VMEPVDAVAFIGRNPLDKNIYISTGDSGMGMTHGTIAGMLLIDLIQGRSSPWAEIYDPSRKTLRSITEYAKENLQVAAKYAEWVTPGEVKSIEEIKADEGAILRSGVSKLAVYRDPTGQLHAYSATCTHLACVVHWNPTEKSWDCPCHGSRFDAHGRVVNGPAASDLSSVEVPDLQKKPSRAA